MLRSSVECSRAVYRRRSKKLDRGASTISVGQKLLIRVIGWLGVGQAISSSHLYVQKSAGCNPDPDFYRAILYDAVIGAGPVTRGGRVSSHVDPVGTVPATRVSGPVRRLDRLQYCIPHT